MGVSGGSGKGDGMISLLKPFQRNLHGGKRKRILALSKNSHLPLKSKRAGLKAVGPWKEKRVNRDDLPNRLASQIELTTNFPTAYGLLKGSMRPRQMQYAFLLSCAEKRCLKCYRVPINLSPRLVAAPYEKELGSWKTQHLPTPHGSWPIGRACTRSEAYERS